jgi:hypothetical protein
MTLEDAVAAHSAPCRVGGHSRKQLRHKRLVLVLQKNPVALQRFLVTLPANPYPYAS